MVKKLKVTIANSLYWSEVFIAFAQVTFATVWAMAFLSIDGYKLIMLVLNIFMTGAFLVMGALLRRKK